MWVWVGASGFGVSPPSRESGPRYLCRPVSEEPVEIIRRMNAAFNAGDYDAMTTFYAADAEFGDHMALADVAQAAQSIGVPRGI
jgi:hypothetical protein